MGQPGGQRIGCQDPWPSWHMIHPIHLFVYRRFCLHTRLSSDAAQPLFRQRLRSFHRLRSLPQLHRLRERLRGKLGKMLPRDLSQTFPSNLLAEVRCLFGSREFLILAERADRCVAIQFAKWLRTDWVGRAIPDAIWVRALALASALTTFQIAHWFSTYRLTLRACAVRALRRTNDHAHGILAHSFALRHRRLLASSHALRCLATRVAMAVAIRSPAGPSALWMALLLLGGAIVVGKFIHALEILDEEIGRLLMPFFLTGGVHYDSATVTIKPR